MIIRQLQGQEMLDQLYALNSYSLHPSPPYQDHQEWESIVRERQGITCYAAYEGDQAVSVAVSTPMTQNMRGKLFAASAIWGVSTFPSARRKGFCRQVMARLLSTDREAGRVFSNLYPFRESFYERLGYVAFPMTKIARIPALSLSPCLKMETGGEIRLQYIGEAYDAYREYLAQMRLHKHGMTLFDFGDRVRANQNLIWIASAMFNGEVEGLMLYRILGEEVSKYNFSATRFYYLTSRARYLMLNWIARHIDQANRVEIWVPADEYPETWLSDLEVKVDTPPHPAMSRVLDVENINGMLIGEGSFSVRIVDPLCPWNEGNWRFESVDGLLEVSRASTAECELTIQGLTALISGAHDPQDIPLRNWGATDSRIQAIQGVMFPKQYPFMHEVF
jgi:predicted acetyltransferase